MGLGEFVKELFRLAFFAWWNKVTENYGKKPPAEPKYVVDYPEEYTPKYFPSGLPDYRWIPAYKEPLNHLYNNDEMFKYKKPMDKYV
jgi:hypothetical protein